MPTTAAEAFERYEKILDRGRDALVQIKVDLNYSLALAEGKKTMVFTMPETIIAVLDYVDLLRLDKSNNVLADGDSSKKEEHLVGMLQRSEDMATRRLLASIGSSDPSAMAVIEQLLRLMFNIGANFVATGWETERHQPTDGTPTGSILCRLVDKRSKEIAGK